MNRTSAQGRMETQAPDIDGHVLINDAATLEPSVGRFYNVEITGSMEYDLIGRIVAIEVSDLQERDRICRQSYRPFCSERCKLIDLGRWAGGEYCVPTAERPPEEIQDPMEIVKTKREATGSADWLAIAVATAAGAGFVPKARGLRVPL